VRRYGFSLFVTLVGVLCAAAWLEWQSRVRLREFAGLLYEGEDRAMKYRQPSGPERNREGWHEREVGPRVAGRRRVVVLGDSVTAATYLPAAQTFTRVAEDALRARGVDAEVLNLGVIGYDIQQIAAIARRWALRLEPDVVVYAYFTNDSDESEFLHLGRPPLQYYVGWPVDPAIALGPPALSGWLREHSRWYGLTLSARGARLRDARVPPDTTRWGASDTAPEGDNRFWDVHAAALLGTVGTARLRVLAIPPHPLVHEDAATCDRLLRTARCSDPVARLARAEAWFTRRGVPVVSGLAAYRSAPRHDFFHDANDPVHPNAAGHAALGVALAGSLAAGWMGDTGTLTP
jgi:lysophospholipase L1-like esterase